jgi:hypothetical protein
MTLLIILGIIYCISGLLHLIVNLIGLNCDISDTHEMILNIIFLPFALIYCLGILYCKLMGWYN